MNEDDTPTWPSIHYDFARDQRPAQHEPGEHITPPVSHEPWERDENLEQLILACIRLWGVARHPRTDATWPRLQAMLRQYRRRLTIILDNRLVSDEESSTVWTYLRWVEFYLGQRDDKP